MFEFFSQPDLYFRNLMDVKEVIGERKPKDDSEGLRMVKAAIKVFVDIIKRSLFVENLA